VESHSYNVLLVTNTHYTCNQPKLPSLRHCLRVPPKRSPAQTLRGSFKTSPSQHCVLSAATSKPPDHSEKKDTNCTEYRLHASLSKFSLAQGECRECRSFIQLCIPHRPREHGLRYVLRDNYHLIYQARVVARLFGNSISWLITPRVTAAASLMGESCHSLGMEWEPNILGENAV
jgi:hypothetical protein